MDDPLRPNKADFERVLHQSSQLWSSYLCPPDTPPLLPRECLNLKGLLQRTPSFLGCNLLPEDTPISLNLLEKGSQAGQYALFSSCRSIWRTSTNLQKCPSPPKAMPAQLVAAVQSSLTVHLSDSAPLTQWPGTQGASGQAQGNYTAVVFLAWAYILSARWAEIMERVTGCTVQFSTSDENQSDMQPNDQYAAAIELGYDAHPDEARWWRSILSGSDNTSRIALTPQPSSVPAPDQLQPPSSHTALEYLTRFSTHHHLHAQTAAALAAALYIPFLQGKGKPITLPIPKQPIPPPLPTPAQARAQASNEPPIPTPTHTLLPYFMTLSTNPWGIRSLLHSTFFSPEIECNLVSAWLNPAFAVMHPLLQANDMPALLTLLARRAPRLGGLWLGAFIVGIASSILRDVRNGMVALELNAAAWAGREASFIMLKPEVSDGVAIRREDEGRLLFLTSSSSEGGGGGGEEGWGWSRAPVYPWKPLGVTALDEAELQVRLHASCGCHCLEYRGWRWGLVGGGELEDVGVGVVVDCGDEPGGRDVREEGSFVLDSEILASEVLTEVATRGIFGWLRARGYPASERAIYQHEWVDLASEDEDEEHEVEGVESSTIDGSTGS
ncbi:hypothetical protein BP00DRAFT_485453 [Aspergillus indologenus CBS 114.80]|uniref:Uncharacterized protein n=1 Tax=Aspergillus indologenus CBS 114.80 TaxID=1450541 RepID=A0A2V5IGC2_9EURO|nr:hypothetical protein BP00DRAFT_485453 [Aspergillus indologenus CBS 114.80]